VRIGEVARDLGVSPTYVRKLADAGVIPHKVTQGGHRLFDLPEARAAFQRRRDLRVDLELPLAGLEEDKVWDRLQAQAPPRRATKQAIGIARYAFTELVNNATDHSGGTKVSIRWAAGTDLLRAEIEDDGIGAFERIRIARALPDHRSALAELSKGKVTTQPERHSGEGLFFTSRAVDYFDFQANGLRWTVDNRRGDFALGSSSYAPGTLAIFEVDAATTRRLEDVFRPFTDEDLGFSRSYVRVKLFEHGSSFVSRSEAKRLLAGLELFAEVELDFDKVESVGQGFADEVFRVWAKQHPEVRLIPTQMNDGVALMIGRATATRDERTQT
jgi:anti-sigma regulatory factor (Ser/Thr protein kinase)